MSGKFNILLWKTFKIQSRKPIMTLCELIFPILSAIMLTYLRTQTGANILHDNITSYSPFTPNFLPSRQCPPPDNDTSDRKCYDPGSGIFYVPNNIPILNKTFETMKARLGLNVAIGYGTETELVKAFPDLHASRTFAAGIVFVSSFPQGGDSFPNKIKYKMRFKSFGDDDWKIKSLYPKSLPYEPRSNLEPYSETGFLEIQWQLDRIIIETVANLSGHKNPIFDEMHGEMGRFPFPPYETNLFAIIVSKFLPVLMVLSFLIMVPNIVKERVIEKETKMAEFLKIMGVPAWMQWLSVFIKFAIFVTFSTVVTAILFYINFKDGKVIAKTNVGFVFLLLWLYGCSLVSFALLLTCFFSKSSLATPISTIVFLATYVPYAALKEKVTSEVLNMMLCLLPATALGFGFEMIAFTEKNTGISLKNINQQVYFTNSLTLLNILIMQAISTPMYFLLGLYIEKVFPGQYGIPLKWYFFLQPSYWITTPSVSETKESESMAELKNKTQGELFESYELKPGVQIIGLRKEFTEGFGKKVAVDGVYLELYEDQITVLLGHNGAGKTTTMMMLTGFYKPTSGTAYIGGQSISNMAHIRKSLGLCPQYNVLYDLLTVQEHLRLFSCLRSSYNPSEISDLLEKLEMSAKRDALSSSLSGGMKRKLSLAVAFAGSPKVVILDEPSSGVDPEARREIWGVIETMREGHTILLTTHFMDEADCLGNRIAIMAEGKVFCCGSPLFLKKKFDVGYSLTMVKLATCDLDKVQQHVQNHIPEANVKRNIGTELTFNVPLDSSKKFEQLFLDIDSNKELLGIGSYGISLTTMEEVFLKVGELTSQGPKQEENLEVSVDANKDKIAELTKDLGSVQDKKTGLSLYLQQVYAMFLKRVISSRRAPFQTILRILLPIIFGIIACKALKDSLSKMSGESSLQTSSSLKFGLQRFHDPVIFFKDDTQGSKIATLLKEHGEKLAKVTTSKDIQDDLVKVGESNYVSYVLKHILAVSVQFSSKVRNDPLTKSAASSDNYTIQIFFNGQLYHSCPIGINFIQNALIHLVDEKYSIETINHPFPYDESNEIGLNTPSNNAGLSEFFEFAVVLLCGFGFAWSFVALFLVYERLSGAKQMQFISGANICCYWLANFLFDILLLSVSNLLIFVAIVLFGFEDFYEDGRWLYTLGGLLLSEVACLPYLYVISFLFQKPASGFIWIYLNSLVVTVILSATYEIMVMLNYSKKDIFRIIASLLHPQLSTIHMLRSIFLNSRGKKICTDELKNMWPNMTTEKACDQDPKHYCCWDCTGMLCIPYQENELSFSGYGLGTPILFLVLTFFIYSAVLLFFDSTAGSAVQRWIGKIRTAGAKIEQKDDDHDVQEERNEINTANLSDLTQKYPLVAKNLSKVYGNFVAVKHLTFKIEQGEIFGLLGVNGAGKTSTFQMLTGNNKSTMGDAYIAGKSVNKSIGNVRKHIGYCPQFDAFLHNLTVSQNLRLFARLRGIHHKDIERIINQLMSAFLVEKYADVTADNMSGGNQRKLSTAIAVVGDPKVIFLDEPTTGMDVVARRCLWTALLQLQASGKTIILTSHSMEECEALCSRLVIMVAGQFRCLGSIQYLKSKFGGVVTVTAKLAAGETADELIDRSKQFVEYLISKLPGTSLSDQHQGYLNILIDNKDLSLARIFKILERTKPKFAVQDFSVSQATLEHIFLSLVEKKEVVDQPEKRFCPLCRCMC